MNELKKTIMERDKLTSLEADDVISQLKDRLYGYIKSGDMENAFYVCEEIGLEPDYLLDLI